MSYLKTINIQHLTSGTNNIVLDANGNMTCAGTVSAGSSMGMRNRIINGDMGIDQRNNGASVTPNNNYTLDRWFVLNSQTSKLTVQQSSTAPTGFTNSAAITSSSTYSVVSGDYFTFSQRVEGLNITDLAWGSSNARTITLSFWVRSSLTGTFGGAIRNSAANRSYPFTYTINTANTWEYETITIPGDTTGTWLTTNGIGIELNFALGAGSTYSGTAGVWAAGGAISATGATSLVGTNGATFFITGVQLEVGTIATPFERILYSTELALCQRYYQTWGGTGSYEHLCVGFTTSTVTGEFCLPYLVTMRSAPVLSLSSAAHWNVTDSSAAVNCSGITIDQTGLNSTRVVPTFSGLTANRPAMIRATATTAARFNLSAEL